MVLEITVAEQAGFCFGVQRAINITMEAVEQNSSSLYILGPLIHNPQVVASLERKGVNMVTGIEEIEEGTLIIRSHGVPPAVKKEAEAKGITIIDATCPFVAKAQRYAVLLDQQGYQVLISGDKEHPEVIAMLGFVGDKALVIQEEKDLVERDLSKKVGIVAQTTQSIERYQRLVEKLVERTEELLVYNTICTTTAERQSAALQLAKEMDMMLVIGGFNSANTSRLAQICRDTNTPTIHLETARSLKREWFIDVERVGITAGASTPKWIIKEVVNTMQEFEDRNMEEEERQELYGEEEPILGEKPQDPMIDEEEAVDEEMKLQGDEEEQKPQDTEEREQYQPDPELEAEEKYPEGDDEEGESKFLHHEDLENDEEPDYTAEQMEEYEETLRDFKQGDVVNGTVVQIKDKDVYVDIGYKAEGIIPIRELDYRILDNPEEAIAEGDEIEVCILKMEDEEGNLILSKKRVDQEKAWQWVVDAFENDKIIEGKVTKVVKGGLVVDLGLRGFIPASHVAIEYVENLDAYVGEELRLKVIEVERHNNNVVLSRKKVLEKEREQLKEETMTNLEEGQVIDGKVTKIVDFGAFVDIGGVEGLLHISEMSWGRIGHPSEVVEEGQDLQVKVLGINREEERISLGLKQILPDPWDNFVEVHYEGEVVPGTITKLVSFGAFMKIEEGIEGLIHISQLSHRHIPTPDDVVSVGDQVEAKIININKSERKVGLSLKEVDYTPPEQQQEEDSGITTIGDRVGNLGNLGNLFKEKSPEDE